MHSDETLVVHEGEKAHDELAVHTIGDATVSWDAVAKILNLECAFQTRGKEATERRNE